MRIIRGWLILFLLIYINSCKNKKSEEAAAPIVTGQPISIPEQAVSTASGLKFLDIQTGDGEEAVAGKTAVVHYTGWLLNGQKFDSSLDRQRPFQFVLGRGEVIPGWDEGIRGMKVGGKRRLFIPYQLAYGERGYPPVIPPRATLVFDVQLLELR